MKTPRCVIIAGPNGAGKTTFATDFLPRKRGIERFVNADLIAAGISPLKPELATLAAGRVFLEELDRLAASHQEFGFESTLSGQTYVTRLKSWKAQGYRIEIIFLWLPSVELAKARVKNRVRQGGHHVPEADIVRRYQRGWKNFITTYAGLADAWSVFDNSTVPSRLISSSS
jgi:predicted ABC-type ATPase